MKQLFTLVVAVLCMVGSVAYAQDRTVSGTVKGADGSALPGITVTVKGTRVGAVTNARGEYSIAVPAEGRTLTFRSIGYKLQDIEIGDRTAIDVVLKTDAKLIDEIVVTGVSEGTSVKKLGFAIAKVSEAALKEVPAVDAANALRGKVSGVQIVQSTGIPGTSPDIRLRGATNIQGGSKPLIIIDGTLTPAGTSLADINMNDVASIEVVKGAAAASLYGSQAANGVIQILTRRGSGEEGRTEITARTEWGTTDLQREFPVSKSHYWVLNPDGSFKLSDPVNLASRTFEADQIMDNKFPKPIINHQRELLGSQPFNMNYLSVASTLKNTNFLASFDRLFTAGILKGVPAYERINARLNVDQKITERLKFTTSLLYSSSTGPDATERQQGGPFYGVLYLDPDFDLYQPNPDGTPNYAYPGRLTSGNNAINPLYSINTSTYNVARQRFLSNFALSYNITDWLKLDGQVSYDRTNRAYRFNSRKTTYNANMSDYTGGSLFVEAIAEDALVGSASANARQQFGDINFDATLRYQFERYTRELSFVRGSRYVSEGVPQVQNLDPTTLQVYSEQNDVRAENTFLNAKLDYRDMFGVDGLIRRDGSSLFGADQRYQFFGRGAAWLRITELLGGENAIPGIQDLKIRAAYGTSGQRPPFIAQYETFNLVAGIPVKALLGNRNLRPSRVAELELGTNITFLDGRLNFEANYAISNATDQILRVPLFGGAGFAQQYQNAGAMQSTTIEFSLGGEVIRDGDFKWNSTLNAYRSRSVVTELGVPSFATNGDFGVASGGGIAGSMFEIRKGEVYGVMYGNILARSSSQLITDAQGNIINLVGVPTSGANVLKPADLVTNSDGYLIRRFAPGTMTPNEGTITERTFSIQDTESGQALRTKIGDSNPDWIVSFANTFSYKGLSLYVLLDAQVGGNIYNATKQLLYFAERHADLDQANKPVEQRKAISYYTAATSIYNGNNAVSHFVEDGSFLTVREINVAYTFSRDWFESIGLNFVRDVRLAVIGRNLFTFTRYTGYSPEVALADNSVNFRVDQFTYPVFRTFTASLQIRF
jgi:TonB-linked SusC/RagA family outer membrane protein